MLSVAMGVSLGTSSAAATPEQQVPETSKQEASNLSAYKAELNNDISERRRAVLRFNIGRILHNAGKYSKARSHYRAALDSEEMPSRLAARIQQNLGVLYHQQAQAVLQKSPEKSLKKTERAEHFYRSAMRTANDTSAVAGNQERLLHLRAKAEELKERRQKQKKSDSDKTNHKKDGKEGDKKDSARKNKKSEREKGKKNRNTNRKGGKKSADSETKPQNEQKASSQKKRGQQDQNKNKQKPETKDASATQKLDLTEKQARALLREMQKQTKDYREAIKQQQQRGKTDASQTERPW